MAEDSKLKKLGRFAAKTSPLGLAAGAVRSRQDNDHAAAPDMPEAPALPEESMDVAAVEGMDEPGQADALESYKVVYRGGHPDYPKPKVSGLNFGLYPDRFEVQPTKAAKKWFHGLRIPYDQVSDVQIVARQVSSVEGMLGGLNSRQLNQDNNIHITYDEGGRQLVLRLEMLTGVTVMGQAKKCREFEDRLRNLGIHDQFIKPLSTTAGAASDLPGQIAKLAELRDQGVLTEEEFQAKKAELLSRM